jgi:microcompartment protein PduM
MDPIVSQVIERLKKRNEQSSEVTYSKNTTVPTDDVFVNSANLVVKKVSIELISELYRLNTENPWVSWILEGLDYEVDFQLNISKRSINFIPLVMIKDWPILFVVDGKNPVYSFYSNTIYRSNLAAIPDDAIVVMTNNQKLTSDAEEISSLKNLKLQVRTDENCIWQKW